LTPKIMKVCQSWIFSCTPELINLEICEDVKEECEKYGKVLDMKVPRPTGGSRQSTGVGKIFVKFDTPESAGKALRALAGRKFADRTVVTTYFSEVSFRLIQSLLRRG
jgi:splicing factor U2AF subunit